MAYTIAAVEGTITLALEGSVTARDVAELARQLAGSLSGTAAVRVGTDGLEDIDTSVLQLLVAVRKTVAALEWEEPSAVLASAVERCALRRELAVVPRETV